MSPLICLRNKLNGYEYICDNNNFFFVFDSHPSQRIVAIKQNRRMVLAHSQTPACNREFKTILFKMKIVLCVIVTILTTSLLATADKDDNDRKARSISLSSGTHHRKKYHLSDFQVSFYWIIYLKNFNFEWTNLK